MPITTARDGALRRTVVARAVVTLLAAAVGGCGERAGDDAAVREESAAVTDTAASAPPPVDLAPVDCSGLETSILAATVTRQGFHEAFGEPDSVAATTEPNRHVEGAIDSLFTVHYPGMLASFRTPAGGADLATGVELTESRYIRVPALAIGAPESQVIAVLGEPTRREAEALVYDCGMGAEQPVTFRLRDGIVASVSIEYYVD